jgi:hypothetical protein
MLGRRVRRPILTAGDRVRVIVFGQDNLSRV